MNMNNLTTKHFVERAAVKASCLQDYEERLGISRTDLQMTSDIDARQSDLAKRVEVRRVRKEEIAKQLAALQREQAALSEESETEIQLPPPQSPARKRKSDVLAEASPVKSKLIARDDTLDVRPQEKRKLEFSGSLINKAKPAASFYGAEPSKTSRHDRLIDRGEHRGSSHRSDRDLNRGERRESSRDYDRDSTHSAGRNAVPGPSRDRSSTMSTGLQGHSSKRLTIPVKKEGPDVKPSILSTSLASRRRQGEDDSQGEDSKDSGRFGKRDAEDLTVLEDLQTGPTEFGRDPEGMAEWTWVEPNSGINLRQRYISHNDVQEVMTSRYYLSPSRLYSVIRLSKDRQHYDVPLDSDWVTVAIVCGKSELKSINTGTGRTTQKDDSQDDEEQDQKPNSIKGKTKVKGEPGEGLQNVKKKTRKFVTLRLCSLPTKTSRKGTSVGGDTMLNLLLFEADSETRSTSKGVVTHHYRGGSGGAYEKWWKLDVGSVIGMVAPKVLKPWGKTNQAPNPLSHPLGLTPSTAEDIFHIGKSQDLGQCEATKRDGNRCDDWIDNISIAYPDSDADESPNIASTMYITVSNQASTSGFELRAKPSGNVKDEYDPIRKTGLLPKGGNFDRRKLQFENNAGGQAYIVGGTMISGNRSAFADEFVHERLGREKGRKLKRKKDDQAEEEALQRLLKNEMASGSTGAKYLRTIQELNNSKDKDKTSDKRPGSTGLQDTADAEDKPITGMPFKIETIRKIGFNPAAYNDPLQGLRVSEETSKTLEELRERTRGGPSIKFGRMPGHKLSNVVNPLLRSSAASRKEEEKAGEEEEKEEREEEEVMVDLGTSDVEDNGDSMVDLE
ncbi:hypothetical protein QFC21_002055 [Naganishia friedmannii]|uniref:Uncharacterized protein n=1 Tax=Naganishia friedmannii TaxID=89922 RepID=A0ACC2VZ06_9TREE|nr:hypothetical protein QFC21_002055 [Naganishia friedmannii]